MLEKELEEYIGYRVDIKLKQYPNTWYDGVLEKFPRKSGGNVYGYKETGPFVEASEIEKIRGLELRRR